MRADLRSLTSVEVLILRPSIRSYGALVAPWLVLAFVATAIEVQRPSPEVWFPAIPLAVATGFATWLLLNRVVLEPSRLVISTGFTMTEVHLADVARVTASGWRVRKGPFIPFGFLHLAPIDGASDSLAQINVKLFRRRDIQRLLDALRAAGVMVDV